MHFYTCTQVKVVELLVIRILPYFIRFFKAEWYMYVKPLESDKWVASRVLVKSVWDVVLRGEVWRG